MLGNSDINVKIGATDATGAAFRSAEQKMKSFAGMAKGAMGALGVGLSVGAIAGAVKSAIDFGSSLDDAAVATQTNVEALQVFRYAATQAGASTGQMDKALIKLNDSAYAASIGSKAEADALLKLGINAQEFARLSPEKRFELLATSIVKAKDQNMAMSAAMDLMGSKNAPFLMAVLKQLGKDGFQSLKKDAENAGQIMSADTIKRLDDAGNAIDRLKIAMTIKTGEGIAFLEKTDEQLDALIKKFGILQSVMNVMGRITDPIGQFGRDAKAVYNKLNPSSGDRFSVPSAHPAVPIADSHPGVLAKGGSGTFTGPDGVTRNFDEWMKETQRTAEISLDAIKKLTETNDTAAKALSQIKTARQ